MKQLYALLFCSLLSFQLPAQELAKKSTFQNSVSEKFLVLKHNKSVKHGQYLRIYTSVMYGENLIELGQYDNNQKTGTWISFYQHSESNSIRSVGDYQKGQKNGVWTYYHELYNPTLSIRPVQGSAKRTRITPPEKDALEYSVEVNGENHILESTGQYVLDKKVGIWEYFDYNGNLAHKFDHDSGKLLEDRTEKPEKAYITYLGGMNRFRMLYFSSQHEKSASSQSVVESSEAVFELEENGTFRFVSVKGDPKLRKLATQTLSTLPNEWIYAENDTANKAKLQVIVTAKKSEDKRGLFYKVDFKVVE